MENPRQWVNVKIRLALSKARIRTKPNRTEPKRNGDRAGELETEMRNERAEKEQ